MKVIIDCDPGVDDALALLMCFSEASRRKRNLKQRRLQTREDKEFSRKQEEDLEILSQGDDEDYDDDLNEHKEEIEILALCTTYGNVNCDQTTKNAAKILASADHFACFDIEDEDEDKESRPTKENETKRRQEKLLSNNLKGGTNPLSIYKGCSSPLVKNETKYYPFHGEDGIGDAEKSLDWIHCFQSNSPSGETPLFSSSSSSVSTSRNENIAESIGRTIQIESEHASIAINRLCSKYIDEVTLIILGPMTNVALATKLDPNLPHKVKEVIWMGGTTFAKGNVTLTSEFNIHNDPEAAHIVLSEFPQTVMVTWECTIDHALEWKLFDEFLAKAKAKAVEENGKRYPQAFLLSHIMMPFQRDRDKFLEGAFLCDAVAMAVALERIDDNTLNQDIKKKGGIPTSIVLKEVPHFVDIELGGKYCRGQTVLDWDGNHPPNVKRVERINMQRFHQMLLHILEN